MAELGLNRGARVGRVGHMELLKLSSRQKERKIEGIWRDECGGVQQTGEEWVLDSQGIFLDSFS